MIRSSARPFTVAALMLVACSSNQSSGARPASSPRGSGTIITAADIEREPGMPLEQLLLARIPGLTIARNEDGQRVISLRGSGKEMLVVLNGVPLAPNASGNLNAINRNDIESITVLRDAASTSSYGSRGANGVILIRTKQG
ncbi:MAG TPA: TonB-dependent receptor plug domain-containing protein [Gemmatimonadales bacterium]|jgi:TonB-dependent SusC/RagA subfamily outer membrane receptor|nr:TonB-dependent receptor plug domain-containing protein [Gemmatimonadales bacterium]